MQQPGLNIQLFVGHYTSATAEIYRKECQNAVKNGHHQRFDGVLTLLDSYWP